MADVFPAFVEHLQAMLPAHLFAQTHYRLIDSMPIILAQRGRRFHAKVAPEIADKNGYCATISRPAMAGNFERMKRLPLIILSIGCNSI